MDIVVPLPSAPARASEMVREKEVIDFIWDHIICRFGIPFVIVCDNRKQFIGSRNGQAELTNKTIIQNLKKRSTNAKGKWKEIIPEVLWAYRTTSNSGTVAIPFSLVYGAEALIPVEVGKPSIIFQ
ncbi:uncharacterized protein [Nicotiana sylvestris]|uniref:uncharacterized protein n=1 Tax=Nicotiana sylvestris TaxID=4096 RepID=UPI00388CAC4E